MSFSSFYSRRSDICGNLCWLVDTSLVLSTADLFTAIQHGLPTKRVNQRLLIWRGSLDLRLALAELQQQMDSTVLLLFQELLAPDSISLGVDLMGRKEKKRLETDFESSFLAT
jgi:hypothetical protein